MLGFFVWVLFWMLVPALIWRLGGKRRAGRWYGQTEPTALDILKTRYAKGEINKQEFEEKKKDII
jgi:putative membrane protein